MQPPFATPMLSGIYVIIAAGIADYFGHKHYQVKDKRLTQRIQQGRPFLTGIHVSWNKLTEHFAP